MTSGFAFHGSASAPLSISCGVAEVQERRQHRPRRDDEGIGQLRNLEQLDPRVAPGACRRTRTRSWWCRDRYRSGTESRRREGMSHRGVWRTIADVRAPRLPAIVPCTSFTRVWLPDVQFELPAAIAVTLLAPQLERADLGHVALERDRHDRVLLLVGRRA